MSVTGLLPPSITDTDPVRSTTARGCLVRISSQTQVLTCCWLRYPAVHILKLPSQDDSQALASRVSSTERDFRGTLPQTCVSTRVSVCSGPVSVIHPM